MQHWACNSEQHYRQLQLAIAGDSEAAGNGEQMLVHEQHAAGNCMQQQAAVSNSRQYWATLDKVQQWAKSGISEMFNSIYVGNNEQQETTVSNSRQQWATMSSSEQ